MSTLKLIGLTCNNTQEARDEPYLVVNGQKVWGKKKMNDGQSRNLNVNVSIEQRAIIELWEYDKIGRNDRFGQLNVNVEDQRSGEMHHTFTHRHASYTLTYEVMP